MKRTQRIDAIRNIKKRIVSYLSICLVIMLGLGGFLTTRYMGAGIEAKGAEYYEERNFKSLEMVSSLGISEEHLDTIANVSGITEVEGIIQANGTASIDGNKVNVTILSLTERISVPEVTEGKLPTENNECMIGEDFASDQGISLGDKVNITITGFGDERPLINDEFTVAGLMHHPDYLRRFSTNTIVLPMSAFDSDVTNGYYTRALVKTDTAEGIDMFSDGYFDEEQKVKNELIGLVQTLKEEAERDLRERAEKAIDEEWAKAEEQFKEAEKTIKENEDKLNEELDAGREKLEAAEAELAAKVAEGEERLWAAEATLNSEVANARAQIEEAESQLNEYQNKREKVKSYLSGYENSLSMLAGMSSNGQADDVANTVLDSADDIRTLQSLSTDESFLSDAKEAQDLTGITIYDSLLGVSSIDVERLTTLANEQIQAGSVAEPENSGDHIDAGESAQGDESANNSTLEEFYAELSDDSTKLTALYNDIIALDAAVSEMDNKLSSAKYELETKEQEGRQQIESGWSTLNSEKSYAEDQISAGWTEYNETKDKYEKELAEAKQKLASERTKGENAVKEAKENLELPESQWIVLDRRANAGYMDLRANSNAMRSAAVAFGILFLLISAMVCFSTLTIIIEEQKQMVGTVKAFGFVKREVLGKYLVFGVSAAIVGCILGIIAALGLSEFLQDIYAKVDMYQFSRANSVITPAPTVVATIGMIAICAIATVIACLDILRSPASLLMKGGKAGEGKKKRKTVSSRRGSLYSKLIVRNMLNDKARVCASIAIIAFSCLMVGAGISLKLAYKGMSDREMRDVYKYDVRVDIGETVDDSKQEKIETLLSDSGTDYLPITLELHMYRWNDRIDGLNILVGDGSRLGEFYGIKDPKTGEPVNLPDDGIIIQNRMNESYGMETGESIPILDANLKECDAEIKGEFQNYVGRTVLMTPEGYKKLFDEENETNGYFVKLNDADKEDVMEALLKISDDISFEEKDAFTSRFESVSKLYSIVVYVTTGIAIIMSFMILTNLANIFVSRKKNELIVMRVNGFSIKKTIGYLARETILTTIIGVALGVALGAILTPVVIKMMEQPDLQFVRDFHPAAWAIAVALEFAFALIINIAAFSKIKDFDLKDIA